MLKPRLNLMMSEASRQRLDRLVTITEAESSAEVIRNALQLYEVMINHTVGDKEFLLRDKKTGNITLYAPFLAVESNSIANPPEPERNEPGSSTKQRNHKPALG